MPSPDLLQAIFANPDDDAPRLVYADWLTEQGDPRGEFIQLGCALASRGPRDPEWSDPASSLVRQSERAKALEAKHAKSWVASVRKQVLGWEFERGFLAKARVKMGRFVEAPAALIEAGPRLDLYVSGFEAKLLGQFCAAPLGKLGCLTLASAKLNDASAKLLASSPTLAGLRGLRLEGAEISLEGLAALVESPHLQGLEELALTYQKGTYGDGVIEVLGRKRLGALRRLELEGIGCTAKTAAAIAKEGVFASKVEQLSLALNPLGDEGLRALMASRQLERLTWLSVYHCGISEKVGLETARSKTLPRALTRISLEDHEWSKAASAAFLARFPQMGSEPPSLHPRTQTQATTTPKSAKPAAGSAKPKGGQKAGAPMTVEEAEKAAMRYAKSKGFKSSVSRRGPVKGLWEIGLSVWAPGVSSNIKVYFDPKTHEFVRVDARKMPSFPK